MLSVLRQHIFYSITMYPPIQKNPFLIRMNSDRLTTNLLKGIQEDLIFSGAVFFFLLNLHVPLGHSGFLTVTSKYAKHLAVTQVLSLWPAIAPLIRISEFLSQSLLRAFGVLHPSFNCELVSFQTSIPSGLLVVAPILRNWGKITE